MTAPYQFLPPLPDDDYAALRQSIMDHGVRVPVEMDEAGNILDGHHRVAVCAELGMTHFPKRINTGLAEWEKRTLARELNVARRHLNTAQKRRLIDDQLRDTPSLSDRALAARLGVSDKTVGSRRKALEDRAEIPHVAERTDTLGRSQPAQRQKTTLVDDSPEGRANVVREAKRVRAENAQASHTMRMEKQAAIASAGVAGGSLEALAASGPFSVVYADPAWKFEVRSEVTGRDKSAENHYPTSTLDEIKAHAPPVNDDAVLFLWCTASNLVSHALPVVAAWGFEYVTQRVWDKQAQGSGYWVFDRHEVLLICKRGQFPCPIPGTQPQSLYSEMKGKHSAKPEHFRAAIVAMTPGLDSSQRLEMNARTAHSDFVQWGYEA